MLYVTNIDGQSGTLENEFLVRYPVAPSVLDIEPRFAPNTGPVSITDLSGTGFHDNATVKLTRASHPDIVATNVTVVDSVKITCIFDLTGAEPGRWNVVVTKH